MKRTFFYNTEIGRIKISENGTAITEIKLVQCDERDGVIEESKLIKQAMKELNEYLINKRKEFTVPLLAEGTKFQKKVWNALKEIPYGETRSYGEIAKIIGNPKSARAVGMANNKNPILIIIPCHRVIGVNGKMVGYACGINIKEQLLKLEENN